MSACNYRVSIKSVILDEQKRTLFIQEDSLKWEMPGGGLEHGEDPIECLKREFREELQAECRVVDTRPIFFQTAYQPKFDNFKMNIYYLVELLSPIQKGDKECIDYAYFTIEEVTTLDLNMGQDGLPQLLKTYLTGA